MEYTIHPIAHIRTDFTDKFGIPRQSGLVPELTARIVFEPEYRDPNALVGIEGYDRLWLIWQFSTVAAEYAAGKSWRPTVRPPRLGGNRSLGVFATRATHRPNGIGQSVVRLEGFEAGRLWLSGIDLLDGTPVLDIKPYVPYADAVADAVSLSPNYLSSLFRKQLHCTFREQLCRIRVEESKSLLLNTEYSLADIALAMGFADQSYYCKSFKRIVGIPPGRFRQSV